MKRKLRWSDYKDRISLREQDDDGYWVYLRDGFQDGCNPGCHIIHENTKAEALDRMMDTEPCDCFDCDPKKFAFGE